MDGRVRAAVRRANEQSFAVVGPRLFNCLPVDIRGYEGDLPGFKGRLDKYLMTVPDKPVLPHYHQAAAGNSLEQQLRAETMRH